MLPKSPLSYVGGKSLLAKAIIDRIPPHTCYVELFAGAAWVFFKKEPSKVEIINDINQELIALYRAAKVHTKELIRYILKLPLSRDEFDRLLSLDVKYLTDIERAARLYFLIKASYGSKIVGQTMSVSATRSSNFNPMIVRRDLYTAQKRLARVTIENADYKTLMPRVDSDNTFFYIDPPYYGCENYYDKGVFSRDDFSTLSQLLSQLRGKFCMSINDTPEIRVLFSGFNICAVKTKYSLQKSRKSPTSKNVTELLIMNY